LNVSGITATYTINQSMVRLSAARPLNVEPAVVTVDIAPHDHDYYEVSIVVRGRCRHHTADGIQELEPGSVIVIAPDGVHAFSRPRGGRVHQPLLSRGMAGRGLARAMGGTRAGAAVPHPGAVPPGGEAAPGGIPS
jgi:hypothetical protein